MPNHLSAFIDASQIYGNSDELAELLRDKDGKCYDGRCLSFKCLLHKKMFEAKW